MPFKHDWDKIKTDYTQGIPDTEGNLVFPTLEELSEKHKVSMSTLKKRSAADDWRTARNMFRTKIEQKRVEQRAELLAGKAAEFDSDVFRVAELGLRHIQGHFLAAEERFRQSRGREPIGPTLLEQLSRAMDRYQRIGRLALGEPTELGGESSDGEVERSIIVQSIVQDKDVAERIAENYRRKARDRFGED